MIKGSKEYVGSCCGNSFVILDCRNDSLSRSFKQNFAKEKIKEHGVDSCLFLNSSKNMDALMEIFEKDGSESESCGNGTILMGYLLGMDKGKIEMKDNAAMVEGDDSHQAILMNLKLSDVSSTGMEDGCVFVKMGEPHIIYMVNDANEFDLEKVGRSWQEKYPEGVNVDVIQEIGDRSFKIRTFERGVLEETRSCGTGSLSSYIAIDYFRGGIKKNPIELISSGGRHKISREGNMLKLETDKKFCKIKEVS